MNSGGTDYAVSLQSYVATNSEVDQRLSVKWVLLETLLSFQGDKRDMGLWTLYSKCNDSTSKTFTID